MADHHPALSLAEFELLRIFRENPAGLDLPTADYIGWLVEQGYTDVRLLGDGRYAALYRFMFTTAIITGRIGDFSQYDDRWCYETEAHARDALTAWDGTGEPQGWKRHPKSGRRRDADGQERVEE